MNIPAKAGLLASGQRRMFLVKRKMQFKIIALVLGAVALAVGLIGGDIYFAIGRDIVRDLMDPGLYGLFKHAALVTLVKMVFYLAGVAFLALLLSNKLAGPAYRFEASARKVAAGDLTHRVKLRHGDELTDLQEAFNGMMESLHKAASQDAALAARVARQLEELAGSEAMPPAALRRLKELQTEVAHIGKSFKV